MLDLGFRVRRSKALSLGIAAWIQGLGGLQDLGLFS